MIRRYNNVIINLDKVQSIKQYKKNLNFSFPSSNWLSGNWIHFSDEQFYTQKFDSEEEAKKELDTIEQTMKEYYSKRE